MPPPPIRAFTLTLLAGLAALAARPAGAQVITVTAALDDYADFGGTQTVADLPGPDGVVTLREAVTAANNTPGAQTIAFAIPLSEWAFWYSDRAIIRLEQMLYVSGDDTTIDFSTQAGFTGDTNPAGGEVGLHYAGVPASIPCLWLAAHRCTIRGLDVAFGNNLGNTIWISGNNNRVVGCTTNGLTIRGDYGGGDNNTIGGVGPGEGNTFSEGVGIYSGASHNVVIGNIFRWGLRINGDTLYGVCEGNRVGGPTAAERNVLSGHGYYASEGVPTGTQLEVQHASNTLIENNYVGTTNDGAAKFPGHSGVGGIAVYTAAVNTIIRNNVVSGFEMTGINHVAGQRFGTAVGVGSTATGTILAGNRIGLSADGATPILNVLGLAAYSDPNGTPSNTRIGGAAVGDSNTIANSETDGIRVFNSATGVRISGNSIFSNGGLGIDLLDAAPTGVTSNDLGDADSGANNLQNFPTLISAAASAAGVRVRGTLDSISGQAFTLEFFASPACDPSGHGEGRTYLGSLQVQSDAGGLALFDHTIPISVPVNSVITATATRDASGDTSEFSPCVSVQAATCPADFNADGAFDVQDIFDFLNAWLAVDPIADFNGGGLSVQDIFDFLNAWFLGCP